MRALVVFESLFGNTEVLARAVAAELAATMVVEVVNAREAPPDLSGLDMLVVGAPTHAFGLSRHSTREDAVRRGAPTVDTARGVREWLASLSPPSPAPRAAAFDTRSARPRLPGSAAAAVAKHLRRLGMRSPTAESFYVLDVDGPLGEGELERARAWARGLIPSTTTLTAR